MNCSKQILFFLHANESCKKYGFVLKVQSESPPDNRGVNMEAVKNAYALELASVCLPVNEDIVIGAVEKNGCVLQTNCVKVPSR